MLTFGRLIFMNSECVPDQGFFGLMWDCIIHVVVVSPIVLGYTRHVILCERGSGGQEMRQREEGKRRC